MIKQSKTIICLLLLISIMGCDNKKHLRDLEEYVGNLKKIGNSQAKVTHSLKEPVPMAYKSTNTRQPFIQPETVASEKIQSLNPLNAFPLTMLKFVGTLTENGIPAAYILTPDNKIYAVKVGDTIGDRHGKIKSIYTNRMEISEIQIDENNHKTNRVVTLQLKE